MKFVTGKTQNWRKPIGLIHTSYWETTTCFILIAWLWCPWYTVKTACHWLGNLFLSLFQSINCKHLTWYPSSSQYYSWSVSSICLISSLPALFLLSSYFSLSFLLPFLPFPFHYGKKHFPQHIILQWKLVYGSAVHFRVISKEYWNHAFLKKGLILLIRKDRIHCSEKVVGLGAWGANPILFAVGKQKEVKAVFISLLFFVFSPGSQPVGLCQLYSGCIFLCVGYISRGLFPWWFSQLE